MINMGRIHKELGKFFMIPLNLIKLDDELMIKIEENGIDNMQFHAFIL